MIKKVFSFLILTCALLFVLSGIVLYYPEIEPYLDRFTVVPIDTAEIDAYYDLLSKHKQSGKNLIVDLGMSDTDGLEAAIDKLKTIMGLGYAKIEFAYYDKEKPPAYIEKEGQKTTVFISYKITDRREGINLLAHELSHIYVWGLDSSVFGACNQEKLVDCASVFLGLGVFTLNGLTDEYTVSPEGGYAMRKKTFGYLEPKQFAYLLARYCAEHNVEDSAIKPYLTSAARKYFKFGSTYLRKRTHRTCTPARLVPVKSAIGRFVQTLYNKLADMYN